MNWWLAPLRDSDVLVRGERVLYRRRRHWAAVLPEMFQLLAVLFLHTAFSMRGTTGMSAFLIFGTVIALIVLRPLLTRGRWDTWQLIVIAVLVFWAIQSGASILGLATLLVVIMAVRFGVRLLRWAFYQRTYLTDRRVMEVDGFLGTRINSMPLAMVTDVMLRRNPFGEMLGYGTFRVESAGQDQALSTLDFLLDPENFHYLFVAGPKFR
ncbi:MAG: PH domain-containing protein [Acidimicrobiales bacterium]